MHERANKRRSGPIAAPGVRGRSRLILEGMKRLLARIRPSFSLQQQRRRLLIGMVLSFIAGPVLAQILLLILFSARGYPALVHE